MLTDHIKTELAKPEYNALSNEDAATFYNSNNRGERVYVPRPIALNFLSVSGLLGKIEVAANNAQFPAELRGRLFDFLAAVKAPDAAPLNFARYDAEIPALIYYQIIPEDLTNQFMALAYVSITAQDVAAARCYAQYLSESAELETLRQEFAAKEARVAGLSVGVVPESP